MKTQTLFRALVSLVGKPQYQLASDLKISTASLSRHADGLLRRPSVLRKAVEFFSGELPESVIDADLLSTKIRGEDLVRLTQVLRKESLKGSK
jgi:hypothetical protein